MMAWVVPGVSQVWGTSEPKWGLHPDQLSQNLSARGLGISVWSNRQPGLKTTAPGGRSKTRAERDKKKDIYPRNKEILNQRAPHGATDTAQVWASLAEVILALTKSCRGDLNYPRLNFSFQEKWKSNASWFSCFHGKAPISRFPA